MPDDNDVREVKLELAAAVGLVVLSDASLQEASERAGVTRWELEETLRDSGAGEMLGVEFEGDVAEEIDRLLEDGSST